MQFSPGRLPTAASKEACFSPREIERGNATTTSHGDDGDLNHRVELVFKFFFWTLIASCRRLYSRPMTASASNLEHPPDVLILTEGTFFETRNSFMRMDGDSLFNKRIQKSPSKKKLHSVPFHIHRVHAVCFCCLEAKSYLSLCALLLHFSIPPFFMREHTTMQ